MRRQHVRQPALRRSGDDGGGFRLAAAVHLPDCLACREGLVHVLERSEVAAEHADGGGEVGVLRGLRARDQPRQVEPWRDVRKLEVEQRLRVVRRLKPKPQLHQQVAPLLVCGRQLGLRQHSA